MAYRGSKEYRKMFKAYRRSLKRLARHASEDPFDGDPGLAFFVEYLRFMRDYYKLGEDVWDEEQKGHDRLEGLQRALDEFDAYDGCLNKYYKLEEEPSDESGHSRFIVSTLLEDVHENAVAEAKEERQHWQNFCKIVMKEFQYWND